MFSKAKRFVPAGTTNQSKVPITSKKQESETPAQLPKAQNVLPNKTKTIPSTPVKKYDTQSQCSSKQSVKSFVTPKPINVTAKSSSYPKKPASSKIKSDKNVVNEDIIKAQEVEIRNKDYTISEYNKQIDELKSKIAYLEQRIKTSSTDCINQLNVHMSKISLDNHVETDTEQVTYSTIIEKLNKKIVALEQQCLSLEQEASSKQVELSSLEEIIIIRDSLCKDLQEKLTNVETCLEETRQRLEMVKGHHALALEANASIRREYKAELEALKTKLEEEKQSIISKCKVEQDQIKSKYNAAIESIRKQLTDEKEELEIELQQQLNNKDLEMKAKLEQVDEATHEKLRLCEIQFEERTRHIQDHCAQLQKRVISYENETKELKLKLVLNEEQWISLQKQVNNLQNENEQLRKEKNNLYQETNELKDETKKKLMNLENQINKLTVEVDKITKEKNKFEMSLSVTRDIVDVLTMRLRESDNELEHLEAKVQALTESKEVLEDELITYKSSLNNAVDECNEYKEALVNILKSKAALAKEHTRIMEHNVSLIESLQHVEKEAYRELGSIKCDFIEDVEFFKKESISQIQILREEVEKKRVLCELATDNASQANAAVEQSRLLLAQAATEIQRYESENQRLQQQIQDQQSLVVELSLLRQENEELTMTVAKQSSMLDKMKKDMEFIHLKPKSPSVMRKMNKADKENIQTVLSPLRERNH